MSWSDRKRISLMIYFLIGMSTSPVFGRSFLPISYLKWDNCKGKEGGCMQWGQIKTLFIISFLILDLFLLQQFLEKQNQPELSQLTFESQDTVTELENSDVTIDEDVLSFEVPSVPVIESEGISFSEDIRNQMEDLEEDGGQDIEYINNNTVMKSTLDEPVDVTEENILNQINAVIPFANQYSYWGWDQEKGVAILFQKTNNRTIYMNQGGVLLVRIEDNQITRYAATLHSFSNSSEEEDAQPSELISPLNVIKQLFDEGLISQGDEISSIDVVYHNSLNLVPGLQNGPQQFAPTWKIDIAGGGSLFVNAIRGHIIDRNVDEFIMDTSQSFNFNLNEANETMSEETAEE
ncbi:hypothetical protein EQV77_13670 [Halobacillus fulvus]|nr:hypothetical protein EQV77_13670 [Halobacillus fulvus]